MAVELSGESYEFGKTLTGEKRVTLDEIDDWSEHQPSTQQENEFIEKYGY